MDTSQVQGKTDVPKLRKKQKLKTLLEYSVDMAPLYITYGRLLEEVAPNEIELINLLKKLSEAIATSKKNIYLLRRDKENF